MRCRVMALLTYKYKYVFMTRAGRPVGRSVGRWIGFLVAARALYTLRPTNEEEEVPEGQRDEGISFFT